MSFNKKKLSIVVPPNVKGARSNIDEGITFFAEDIEKRKREFMEELAEDMEEETPVQQENNVEGSENYRRPSLVEEQGVKMESLVNISGSSDTSISSFIGGYAEMFETISGEAIDCGYFVTLDGRKIRKSTLKDRFILGVTTISPNIIGNSTDMRWKNKYLTDEWGRIKFEDVTIPAVRDQCGNELSSERTERRPVINPVWDKEKQYIPRALRNEWVYVSLLGQAAVRDDGSCRVNGYCIPNDDAVATTSTRGYRVLDRLGDNQIVILLRATILGNVNRN